MRNIITAAIAAVVITGPAHSCIEGHESKAMFPQNDLSFPVDFKNANMTEELFNDIIDNAVEKYEPIFEEEGFKKLKVKRLWSNDKVNASARRTWFASEVNMYGGLARHPLVTADAFTLVLCHEIGHHIGGAPKNTGFFGSWASTEGQSDFWGTSKCTRRLWEDVDNVAVIANVEIPEVLKNTCEAQFNNNQDIAICIRSGLAGISLGETLASLGRNPVAVDINTPDTSVADDTFDGPGQYPGKQCRLDTYVAGAYCENDYRVHVSQSDADVATCTTINRSIGYRPTCWYVQE